MEKKTSILLVDDDLDFLRPIVSWLKSIGYTVAIAVNETDCLQRIKGSSSPDIIFLDIDVPDIGGLVVLEKIRAFNKAVPVIIMIKESRDENRYVRARDLGISGFFSKDSTFDEFVKMLEKILQLYKLYRPYVA